VKQLEINRSIPHLATEKLGNGHQRKFEHPDHPDRKPGPGLVRSVIRATCMQGSVLWPGLRDESLDDDEAIDTAVHGGICCSDSGCCGTSRSIRRSASGRHVPGAMVSDARLLTAAAQSFSLRARRGAAQSRCLCMQWCPSAYARTSVREQTEPAATCSSRCDVRSRSRYKLAVVCAAPLHVASLPCTACTCTAALTMHRIIIGALQCTCQHVYVSSHLRVADQHTR
jgi:hypothetical protein